MTIPFSFANLRQALFDCGMAAHSERAFAQWVPPNPEAEAKLNAVFEHLNRAVLIIAACRKVDPAQIRHETTLGPRFLLIIEALQSELALSHAQVGEQTTFGDIVDSFILQ